MRFDYVLVGGGLQNALIALAVIHRRPRAAIAIVERATQLGGNHTWCFHVTDVPASSAAWLRLLVVQYWPVYDVHFPDGHRRVNIPYCAINSARLHAVVSERLGASAACQVRTGQRIVSIQAGRVLLSNGERLEANMVIDARGPVPARATSPSGYKKFLGLELELAHSTSLERPIVMDATVVQHDGYRFLHVLPFGPRRVLVEDTRFTNSPSLEREELRHEVLQYARSRGMQGNPVREECGVVPMPWRMAVADTHADPFVAGYRGGWFHPATGYSLPVATRLAEFIAAHAPEWPSPGHWQAFSNAHQAQARFACKLNWMLFHAVPGPSRWRIFARFYRLPSDVIGRYYALQSTRADRIALLFGPRLAGRWLRTQLAQT